MAASRTTLVPDIDMQIMHVWVSTQCMYVWVGVDGNHRIPREIHHQYYMWRLAAAAAWCVHVGGCLGKPQVGVGDDVVRGIVCTMF